MIVSFPAAVYYDFIVNVIRDKYYLPFYISLFLLQKLQRAYIFHCSYCFQFAAIQCVLWHYCYLFLHHIYLVHKCFTDPDGQSFVENYCCFYICSVAIHFLDN